MINLDPIETISYDQLIDLLAPYLGNIDQDLVIIGNRMKLKPGDAPFVLALNKREKRIGIIEILEPSEEFPAHILAHADWVAKSSHAIANLNKNDFKPDLTPFIIGLTSSYPEWQNLLSYLKLNVQLFRYRAMTCQGAPLLIFDPLFVSETSVLTKEVSPPATVQPAEEKLNQPSPKQPVVEKAVQAPPPFRYEGFYEAGSAGLTEDEIRYFTN